MTKEAVDLAVQEFGNLGITAFGNGLTSGESSADNSSTNERPHLRSQDAINRTKQQFPEIVKHFV
jgi:hypothetical protein